MVVWGAIMDFARPVTNFLKDQFNLVSMYWSGLSKELVDDIAEGEARIAQMQRKLDEQNKKKVEEREKNDKLKVEIQKEINDRVWDELEATQQLAHLTDFIGKLEENKLRTLEEELALQRAITDANKLREGMTPPTVLDPVGMDADKIPGAVSDYQKTMNTLLNPWDRENNPTLLGYQKRADKIQAERQKRAQGISLANEFNRINYQRGQVGLQPLTPEDRMKIAENRMLNDQASKENLDPMQILADSFRENGALLVKPVFAK
jgi:cysteinyl-tRNA synthetase